MNVDAARIYQAFGLSEAEAAELLASPEHQAYERARAEAAAAEDAFLKYARATAARISAELQAALTELLP